MSSTRILRATPQENLRLYQGHGLGGLGEINENAIWSESSNADTHIQIVTVNSSSNSPFLLGRKLLLRELENQRFSANLICTVIIITFS